MMWVLKLDIWMLGNVYRHVGLVWTLGNLIFFARTKTLILTVLGGNWTMQPLSDFESSGDWSWKILKNMGGQILGYNTKAESSYTLRNFILKSIAARRPMMHASYYAILLVQLKHSRAVLYPKIFPPIFFKICQDKASKSLKGCTVQLPPNTVKIRVLVLAKKLRF